MTKTLVEKLYQTKLDQVDHNIWTDGYLWFVKTKPEVVIEYIKFMQSIIELKKQGLLDSFDLANKNDKKIQTFIQAVKKDKINDVQLVDSGDNYVIYIDTTNNLI